MSTTDKNNASQETSLPVLKAADFASNQDVRWCPGCGDYSILAQVKKVLPKLGIPRENFVFVSGIGCAARFPYYMNTYGMHSIHGRAPAIAMGIKVARPELSVWVVSGDGDALSIGGNHLIHAIRRNLDINILLFNNRIYGLTKGQYSPTSEASKKTKSSPMGSIDNPVRPLSLTLGAEATFVARAVDVDVQHLAYVLERAANHKGTSFVEIYQDCNVFNHGSFEFASDKNKRPDNVLYLEHGKPMIFGKNRDKGIRLNGLNLEVVDLNGNVSEDDLLFHDEKADNPTLAFMLSRMTFLESMPEPMGVLRCVEKPTYEELANGQVTKAIETKGEGRLEDLYNEGDTWKIN